MRRLLLCLFHVCLFATQANAQSAPSYIPEHLIHGLAKLTPDYPKTKPGYYFSDDYMRLSVVGASTIPTKALERHPIVRVDFLNCPNLDLPKVVAQLQSIKYLQALCFVDCQLHRFPEEILVLHELRSFSIAGDSFASVPPSIQQLQKLNFLDLGDGLFGGNNIESLPEELCELKDLFELHLFSNKLQHLPNNFSKLNLSDLDIRHNELSDLGEVLAVQKLIHADVSYNPLTVLQGFEKPFSISELRLTHCGLTSIPESFSAMFTLSTLYLGDNPNLDYDAAFRVIGKLPNLENINLDHCGWERLPNTLNKIKYLKSLSLVNNPQLDFAAVANELSSISTLRELNLSQCGIRELPDAFGKLKQIKKLMLNMNELYALDPVCEMSGLQELEVYGNPMSACDNCLARLPDLYKVTFPMHIHPTQRDKMKRLFSPLVKIEYL